MIKDTTGFEKIYNFLKLGSFLKIILAIKHEKITILNKNVNFKGCKIS